jgi:DNA-binding NarL/FixJ family response regulator
MITVQIVDDHNMVVEALQPSIDKFGIAMTTGIYYDLASCRLGLLKAQPDVLLLDIQLDDGSGIDFCAEVKKNYPQLKIVMFTGTAEFSTVIRSLHNGAHGYILKNASIDELIDCIKAVYKGEIFLCENVDAIMKKNREEDVVELTCREVEVLKLIVDGLTNRKIAEKLHISQLTVKGHREAIRWKLKANNTAEMVAKGVKQQYTI